MVLTNPQHAFITSTNPIAITTTSPLDVNILSPDPINSNIVSSVTLNANILNQIQIDDSTPIDMNVTNASIPITSSVPLDTNLSSVNIIPRIEFIRGNLPTYNSYRLNARSNSVNATKAVIVPDGANYDMPLQLVAAGIPCSFSTDNVNTTMIIRFIYYANSTDVIPISEALTINGQNKVNLSSNFYRMVAMVVDPTSPVQLDAQLWVYDSTIIPVAGVPSDYFDFLLTTPDDGTRGSAIYYSPPNAHSYINSIFLNSDQNQVGDIIEISFKYFPSPLAIVCYTSHVSLSQGLIEYSRSQFEMAPSSTFQLSAQRISGSGTQTLNVEIGIARVFS